MSRIKEVTQETSKTTAVTLNAKNGVINTVALTDALDTQFEFVVNNNKIYPESNIQVTPLYAGTTGVPHVFVKSRDRFTCTLVVANVGVGAFDAAVSINMTVVG